MATKTATTTLQIKDMIGWMRTNSRAARSLVQFLDMVCQSTTKNDQLPDADDNVESN